MIPANGVELAVIETEGERRQRRPIHAWADDGHPMVVGEFGLVRADSCGRLIRIEHNGDGLYPVAAAVPGGGWMTRVEDLGETRTAPVLAWVVRTNGIVTAVIRDSNGDVVDVEAHQAAGHLYHPDETVVEQQQSVGVCDPDCRKCFGTSWVNAPDGTWDTSKYAKAPVVRCGCYKPPQEMTA